jgi:hypothetical protein
MRASELAMQISAMHNDIETTVDRVLNNLCNLFEASPGTDNKDADIQANLHAAMVDYVVSSSLSSKFSKHISQDKDDLDACIEMLGHSSEGIPGQSVLLGKSNLFQFGKKQNQDGTSTPLNAFVTELARAGVEKSVVDKALKAATVPKKGNTYYNVTLVEE